MCRCRLGESEGEPSEAGSQGVEKHVVDVGAVDTWHGDLGQLDAKRGSGPQGHDSPPPVELGPAQRQQEPKGCKQQHVADLFTQHVQGMAALERVGAATTQRHQLWRVILVRVADLPRVPSDREEGDRGQQGGVGDGGQP